MAQANAPFQGAPPEFVAHVRELEARAGVPMVLVHEGAVTPEQAAVALMDPSGSGWGAMSVAEAQEVGITNPVSLVPTESSSRFWRINNPSMWLAIATPVVLAGGGYLLARRR